MAKPKAPRVAAKARAKPRASPKKPKPKARKPKPRDPIAIARAGDLGAIHEAGAAIEDDSQRDLTVYKWLAIASDFGSAEAAEALDDMLATSDLRHDDDHGAQGVVHFELAVSYMTGTDGLPRDLERGAAHLAHARRCDFPEQIQDGAVYLADARKLLDAEALAAFDAVYNGQPISADGDDDDDDGDDEEDYGE